ncbi:MAG TPA: sigma factor, partial [Motiliproteus sp.]
MRIAPFMAIDTELEAELLPQLQRQDDTSFNRLVRLYSGVMLSLARSIVGDAIADEVVQEAWLSAYRALPKFEGRSSLKTWLLRITANQARTRLRKENRSVAMDALSPGGEGVLQGRFAEDGHWRIPPSGWHDDSPEALL